MSCSGGPSAEAPENLSLLHRRLLLAEQEAEALIRDMGALGVTRNQAPGFACSTDGGRLPATPTRPHQARGDELMKDCDSHSLAGRVNHLESQLQTMKLTVFRFETEKDLDPSNTEHLKQELAALRRDSEEEQQALRREVMKLREQLHQARQETDVARTEAHALGETLEVTTATKRDVALATEELNIVKLEMWQKLMEMKEWMRQESGHFHEAMKCHHELLRRTKEMERELETERKQAELLRAACRDLETEVRAYRHRLEEERDRNGQLVEQLHRLREQTEVKDRLVSELKTNLQRQQSENSKLVSEDRELRAAADRVQTLNMQLQTLTLENQAEIKVALSNRDDVLVEMEKLKGEYAQLLQSSCIAQDTANAQRELLEQTIERLRRELDQATREGETVRKRLEESKNELRLVVTKLEMEREALESQVGEAKREAASLRSRLNSQQEENQRLMGLIATLERQWHAAQHVDGLPKGHTEGIDKAADGRARLKVGDVKTSQSVRATPAGDVLNQNLDDIMVSHRRLPLDSQMQQQQQQPQLDGRAQELAVLHQERLQVRQEISKHQAEVESLQQLLASTHLESNKALLSLQRALDTATVDNKRLVKGLEHVVSTNNNLHSKLDQAREQYQVTVTLRDEQLRQARSEMNHLSEKLHAAKQKTRDDQEFSVSALRSEISQLKTAIAASLNGSGDPSKTDPELAQRVSKLEKLVSRQGANLRQQRSQQAGQVEKSEETIVGKQTDGRYQEVNIDSKQESNQHERNWMRWTSTIERWEAQRELAHAAQDAEPTTTQLITH